MAKPIISPTTAYAGARVGTPFTCKLNIQNPSAGTVYWTASYLPDGLTINPVNGEISGTPLVAGPSIIALQVAVDGVASDWLEFAFLVLPGGAGSASGLSTVLWMDIITGQIYLSAPGQDLTLGGLLKPDEDLVIWAKYADIRPFELRFVNGTEEVDLGTPTIRWVMKEFEPEVVIASAETWTKDDALPRWYGTLTLSDARLKSALSNNETDSRTAFLGLSEIEVAFSIGDTPCRVSSKTVKFEFERDLAAN